MGLFQYNDKLSLEAVLRLNVSIIYKKWTDNRYRAAVKIIVIPAQAGILSLRLYMQLLEIPACAGMTAVGYSSMSSISSRIWSPHFHTSHME